MLIKTEKLVAPLYQNIFAFVSSKFYVFTAEIYA
jgi:hypothetical protein